jgi:hypothetical protein
VKEKRLRVSEKSLLLFFSQASVYPEGEVRDSIRTNFGTSMRIKRKGDDGGRVVAYAFSLDILFAKT